MPGRAEKIDVTNRTHFASTTKERRSPFRELQAASVRSRSLSSLPFDGLLHTVRNSRVDYRVFDSASMDHRSLLLSGLRDLDSRRISLPPLCLAWPFSARQRRHPAVSPSAARSSSLGSSH